MQSGPVVLVVGSLHHDIMIEADHLPRRDETAVGRRWYPKFGGKGGNQAVAAARAGVASRMVGAVGDDGFGRFMLGALDRDGVDRRFVRVLDGAGSGMSVAVQDGAGDYAATIVSGANLLIDVADISQDLVWDGVRVLVLQNEVPGTVNLCAAVEARARGVEVVWNAAPTREVEDAFWGLVDVLVVNAVEAEMMGAGRVADRGGAMAAARVLAERVGAVVVTAGAAGLAAVGRDGEAFDMPAVPVRVVSSHGAGDSFVGTLAARMAQGRGLREACADAAAVAARHVAGGGV
jgi:ribokinase